MEGHFTEIIMHPRAACSSYNCTLCLQLCMEQYFTILKYRNLLSFRWQAGTQIRGWQKIIFQRFILITFGSISEWQEKSEGPRWPEWRKVLLAQSLFCRCTGLSCKGTSSEEEEYQSMVRYINEDCALHSSRLNLRWKETLSEEDKHEDKKKHLKAKDWMS